MEGGILISEASGHDGLDAEMQGGKMSLFYCNVCHTTYAWPGCSLHPNNSVFWHEMVWYGLGGPHGDTSLNPRPLDVQIQKSRRERIATAILGGMFGDSRLDIQPNQAARIAISFSDALIEELDKEAP